MWCVHTVNLSHLKLHDCSATALRILSDERQGLSSLQYRCGAYTTPMRMLIQYMPGTYGRLEQIMFVVLTIN